MTEMEKLVKFSQEAPDKFLLNHHKFLEIDVPSDYAPTGLSKQIWDCFQNNKQTLEEFNNKMKLWKILSTHIKSKYPEQGLFASGSTLSGSDASGCDFDMTLLSEIEGHELEKRDIMDMFKKMLPDLETYCKDSELKVINAKVPLIQIKDKMFDLDVDIAPCHTLMIRHAHLMHHYSRVDWRVKPFMIVVKKWAKPMYVINSKYGILTSYAMMFMVIYFLQSVKPAVLPSLQKIFPEKFSKDRSIMELDFFEDLEIPPEKFQSTNTQSLGELLIEFFKHYHYFNYTKYGISIREGAKIRVQKRIRPSYTLYDRPTSKFIFIQDPFILHNVARSPECEILYWGHVKMGFREAHLTLKNTNDLSEILGYRRLHF